MSNSPNPTKIRIVLPNHPAKRFQPGFISRDHARWLISLNLASWLNKATAVRLHFVPELPRISGRKLDQFQAFLERFMLFPHLAGTIKSAHAHPRIQASASIDNSATTAAVDQQDYIRNSLVTKDL